MKRFLRHLLIINLVVALGVGIGGGLVGWTGSTFAQVLGLICIGALGLGFSAFGGSGPMTVGGGPDAGAGLDAADVLMAGAEVGAAYGGKADHLATTRARRGWRPGSHHVAWLLLTTGVLTGIATFVSWSVFG